MDIQLLEQLLHDDENSSLDFKSEQYPFAKASNEQKSELLKDILAFANTRRATDAYILIGVEEVRGGRSIPRGVSEHLGESHLQQFVNGKTNRPVTFSYTVFAVDGVSIGIIRVPVQTRPLYLKREYGSLAANTVYIRQGSATSIASIDEIALMGRDEEGTLAASVEFALRHREILIGTTDTLTSMLLQPPAVHAGLLRHTMAFRTDYEEAAYYYRFGEYLKNVEQYKGVRLGLRNSGTVPLEHLLLEIHVARRLGLQLLESNELTALQPPPLPTWGEERTNTARVSNISVQRDIEGWSIRGRLERLQPKAMFIFDPIYMAATQEDRINLSATLYASNLQNPLLTTLVLQTDVLRQEMDDHEFYARVDQGY